MNEAIRDDFRATSSELELLLWAVWNPIGFNLPLNEYANYVPPIWTLLAEHAEVEVVADALETIEREQMSIDEVGDPRRARIGDVRDVAQLLTDWWYWRFDFPVEFEAGSA